MKKFFRFIPAILYTALIWYVSSKPVYLPIEGSDKLIHTIEYAVLGFLLAFGFELNTNKITRVTILCFIIGVLLGVMDEVHQYFVPGRSADIYDAAVDALGVAVGIRIFPLVFALLSQFRKNILPNNS